MKKNIEEFMKCITYIDPATVLYEDNEGNMVELPSENIKCGCSYLELDKEQYNKMLFEGTIDKQDYNVITIERPTSKYNRTHKEEDRFTIEDTKVKVRQVWLVMNPYKSFKCFTERDKAVEFAKQLNDDVRKHIELI